VLAHALNCFELLEAKTIDRERQGYLEAFTRTWGKMDDLRLSEKDLNFPKSQNTHLHVLEAYTTLNKIHPTPEIAAALRYNIELFDKYMIDKNTYHLRMFLDHDWKDHSPGFTYGHDIEASWLIAKGLESLGDENYTHALMPTLIKIAEVTLTEGVGAHGQVIDSYDFASKTQLTDIVWWVQAEALVGFLFAYSESGNEKYLMAAEATWEFIKKFQIDKINGEWFWLSSMDKPQTDPTYKVGFWKCPYHNGRAMMEAAHYLAKLQ
jgi:cellobiose epimerase